MDKSENTDYMRQAVKHILLHHRLQNMNFTTCMENSSNCLMLDLNVPTHILYYLALSLTL